MIKLPITCSNKYGDSKQTPFKIFNGWTRPEPKPFFFEEESSESDDIHVKIDIYDDNWDDTSDKVYRDADGKRIAGLIEHKKKRFAFMGIFSNGRLLGAYSCPNIDIPFKSPMVRWWNLFYCGGWTIRDENDINLSSDDALLEAVLNKQKPIGFAIFKNDRLDEIVERIKQAGLPYHIKPHFRLKDESFVCVCQKGTVGETLYIDAFLMTYTLMSKKTKIPLLNKADCDFFRSLKDKPLESWLKDWDYANPVTNRDLALTGLLLGYAIESTISLMLNR